MSVTEGENVFAQRRTVVGWWSLPAQPGAVLLCQPVCVAAYQPHRVVISQRQLHLGTKETLYTHRQKLMSLCEATQTSVWLDRQVLWEELERER